MYKTNEEYADILLQNEEVRWAIGNYAGCSEKGSIEETEIAEKEMVQKIIEKYSLIRIVR